MLSRSRLKRFLAVCTTPLALIAGTSIAAAAGYPNKPITLVAPYGPGGASDLASRTLASTAPTYLKQPVLVINRTGAGGVTGSTFVYNSKPDGYTLLLARIGSQTVSPAMKANIPYKYNKFTYLGLLEVNPVICATSVDKPYKTLADLKKAIEANPGKLSYSSAGVGTLLQVAAVMVMDQIGIKNPIKAAIHVPFKGGGNAATAAVTGQVDFVCTNSSALVSYIQGGKLRPLLVTTPTRLKDAPSAPTVRELGYPDLEVLVGWSGVAAPPGTPKAVVDKWANVLQQVKKDKSWNRFTTRLGSVPHILSPEETVKFVNKQYKVFSSLVDRLGMKIK
jgi:tripartite-type tricarboxylate transporter receptor subunit TctC